MDEITVAEVLGAVDERLDLAAPWERAVLLFVPRLTPSGPKLTRFSWARLGSNGEWRAAAVRFPSLRLSYTRPGAGGGLRRGLMT